MMPEISFGFASQEPRCSGCHFRQYTLVAALPRSARHLAQFLTTSANSPASMWLMSQVAKMSDVPKATLEDRTDFRQVLRQIVDCLRGQLDIPGVEPFNATEIAEWLHRVTPEDVAAVWTERKP